MRLCSALREVLKSLSYDDVMRELSLRRLKLAPKTEAIVAAGFLSLLLVVPFISQRIIPATGDEKVYVAQAVEMQSAGNFFLQTLGGEPNYYKGPLQLLLMVLGINVFGLTPWATLLGNVLALLLITTVAAMSTFDRSSDRNYSIWVAFATATSAGVLPFVFVAQMEIFLSAIYAMCFFCLVSEAEHRAKSEHARIWPQLCFWLLAGCAGLLKSPVHSVLLGCSGIAFFFIHNWAKLRVRDTVQFFTCALLGILLCCAGYAPILLQDFANFWATYVERESLSKGANGHGVLFALAPLFTYHLLPWLPIFTWALWRERRERLNVVTRVGLCLLLPTVLFFAWHPYRSTTYLVPGVPILMLLLANVPRSKAAVAALFKWHKLALAPVWLGLALFLGLQLYMIDGRTWFSLTDVGVLCLGVVALAIYLVKSKTAWLGIFASSFVALVLVLFCAARVGEAEISGLKLTRVAGNERIGYFDLQRNVWSEWAQLSVYLGRPIQHLRTPEDVKALLADGGVVMVPGGRFVGIAQTIAETNEVNLLVEPWRRWVVGAPGVAMRTLWEKLWQTRQGSVLMTDFYALSLEGSSEKSFARRH